MKSFSLSVLFASFILQAGLIAQPNSYPPSPQLNVQVQRVPSDNVGTYDGNNVPPSQTEKAAGSSAAAQPAESRPRQNTEYTLSIIKPDGVKSKHIGDIISRFENAGLRIAAIKMVSLTPEDAAEFYNVHRNRPFFPDLVKFMSSGPVVVMVLEGNQAISKNRQLMGATDPKKAEKGTIRADYAESVSKNAVHGSDSPEAAQQEIMFFFEPDEIQPGY